MILVLCPPGPALDQLRRVLPDAQAYRGTVHAAPFHAGTWFEIDMDAHAVRDRLRRVGAWLNGIGNPEAEHFQVCELPPAIGLIDYIEEIVEEEEAQDKAIRKAVPWRAPSPGEKGSPVEVHPDEVDDDPLSRWLDKIDPFREKS